jgi:hypothetical protein
MRERSELDFPVSRTRKRRMQDPDLESVACASG